MSVSINIEIPKENEHLITDKRKYRKPNGTMVLIKRARDFERLEKLKEKYKKIGAKFY